MPPGDAEMSSEDDSGAEDEGQDDMPASNLPPAASAGSACSKNPEPVQSTKRPSRVQSLLHRLFRRGRQSKKDECPDGEVTSQEKVDDSSRVSPRHHQTPGVSQVMSSAKKPSSRLQSVLRKVRGKRDCRSDMPQVSDQCKVPPGNDEPMNQGEEPNRLPTTKDLLKSSQPGPPDRFGMPQHVQVSSKHVCRVENVNVSGDENPCFFGPIIEPTFNVTVVSAPKDQGQDKPVTKPPYSLEAILENQHVSQEDPTRRQDGKLPTPEVLSPSGKPNTQPLPHGEGSVASKIQEAALAEAAADQCEAALRSWYTSTGSYVQMIPWVDDDTKHIMDIYTNLQLVGVGKEGKIKSYKGIFLVETREGVVIRRIILNGLAGVGKSTLIDKVTYDWAMKFVRVLRKFKLVFALKMHSLEQSSELIDAVFAQLLDRDTPIDRHALTSYINANPEKVLILLDGFDEFMTTNLNEHAFGSILNILTRKECRDSCVVVSTRSSHFNRLANNLLVRKPFTHVKVLGFSAEDVEEYVRKFYIDEEPEKARQLFERIQSSDVLLDLARSPMLLLLMCVLWREDSCLPETMFRLYSEALRYIFKRKADTSPDEVSRVVIEIGKIAFHGLISPVQLLSFDESEFERTVLSMAIKVGLVTSQRVLEGLIIQNSIQFMHMTFQEFCAAQYFQSLLTTDPKEFQKILEKLERTIKNHPAGFECLLRFCCGDNEACANHVIKVLRNPASDSALKLALVCFFESQSKSLPCQNLVNEVLTKAVCIEDCNSDGVNAYMWFVKQIMDQSQGRSNAILGSVEELAICRCNLQRWDASLTYCIQGLTHLSILILKACSLTEGNMQHIASSLGNAANLTVLDLSGNECLGGSLPSWVSHLQALKKLEKLKLEDCHLNRRDVRCLAATVGHMGNLQDCTVQTDVHRHSPKDDLVWPTNPLVSRTCTETSGIRLEMIECSLTGTDMTDIVEAMTKRSDLAELILSRNKGLSGSAALWFNPLKHQKCLEQVVLSDCSLVDTDIEHIAESVSEMPGMAELDLSQNNLGGLGASWAPHMQVMKHLQKLSLKYCSLTGDDAKLLAISLSSLANFVMLDLSFNESLGGSAGMWAPYFDQMRSLQQLYLRQCALTSKDVKHIAVPLSNMANCMELHLSSNEQLSKHAVTWAPHVRSMQHLKILVLLGCNLNKQDLKHLAASFGDMPNLVDCSVKSAYLSGRFLVQPTDTGISLDLSQRSLTGKDLASILGAVSKRNDLVEFMLSGNDSLSGSAELWSPYLKQLKHLERLELHHCSLQRTDMEHIAAILKDMASLIKLDLSLNDTMGGLCKLWSPHLKQMKHLQMLDLSSCALTGDDIKHIASSMCDIPNLTELKLSHNGPLGGTVSSWAASVQLLSHLETLDLDDCNIKRQKFKYIAASIGHMANLTNCSVRSNYMGSRFQCLIQPISSGIQVYLSERSLTGTDLADILEGLGARDDLVELSLVGNNALGNSAILWSRQLKQLKHLAVLVLNRCSLRGSDIEHIALSLSDMPALRVLELAGNAALGGVCGTWALYLRHVQHIQKLHLGSCSLKFDDMKHIAEACSMMPELSALDLSGNEALSGCAVVWAPFLNQLQQLRQLDLQECSLTGEDRQHVCLSVNDFTNCSY
ncbi:protein NLRC5-like [Patiria miniata]|uniref:NACHT domain-containing protein n=1 Tax=Patiria miniata TaxID=46514 RepID=A0A913YXX9_PATMI|nr:protein NLRC5-like [Patiria miniata]XP_038044222.1 protein NLRC5-like [Patiria miniata]